MSKVFIVRLCVIQFTRYIPFAAANFDILSQNFSFVKYFFRVFPNFFLFCSFLSRSPERSHILADYSLFVKHFFDFLQKFLGTFASPQKHDFLSFILHPRSSHSRRHYACKRPRRHRYYPHPGKRRSCAPAGSSAGLPPHGSWDGSRIP